MINPAAGPPLEVRPIAAEQTRPMRVEILRPASPVDDLVFPGDDDELTLHVGAFEEDGELLGITSVYAESRADSVAPAPMEWRLRGVATAPSARRRGVGSALMAACLDHVEQHGGDLVWCNARTPAVAFYTAHGFVVTSEEFEIEGAGPHHVMERRLG